MSATQTTTCAPAPTGWALALSDRRYDRDPALSPAEVRALAVIGRRRTRWPKDVAPALARLTVPIEEVLDHLAPRAQWWGRSPARGALLLGMHREQQAFWAFDRDAWVRVITAADPDVRQSAIAVAYLLCDQRVLHRDFPGFKKVFHNEGLCLLTGNLSAVSSTVGGHGGAVAFRDR